MLKKALVNNFFCGAWIFFRIFAPQFLIKEHNKNNGKQLHAAQAKRLFWLFKLFFKKLTLP